MLKPEKSIFESTIEKMYGNHGKQLTAGAKAAAYEQLCHLPESFLSWAKEEVYRLDTWPSNFPRFILTVLYPKWQALNGEQKSRQSGLERCPECDIEMPGFITAWRHDRSRVVFKCLCNDRPEFENMPKLSRKAISRLVDNTAPNKEHYFVPPPGYKVTTVENKQFPPRSGLGNLPTSIKEAIQAMMQRDRTAE